MEDVKSWSHDIAEIVADALIDAELIEKQDFDKAVSIIEEEISVRLVVGDYPPLTESQK